MIKFAKDFASGKYKDCCIFIGLVEAFIKGHEQKLAGKSLRGMMYSEDLDALSHSLYARSPQAYRLLQSSLQLRSPRSLQYVVPKSIGCWIMQTHPEMNSEQLAKQPHFPIHITHLVYSRAKVYLSKIGYEGFCALACDDTKLLPSL